jgi:hypothetical protein
MMVKINDKNDIMRNTELNIPFIIELINVAMTKDRFTNTMVPVICYNGCKMGESMGGEMRKLKQCA